MKDIEKKKSSETSKLELPPSMLANLDNESGAVKRKHKSAKKTATVSAHGDEKHEEHEEHEEEDENIDDTKRESTSLLKNRKIAPEMLAADFAFNYDDPMNVPHNCAEQVELFAKYVWVNGWKALPHHALPDWLRDNDFLLSGHRPPLPCVKACFKSIFRIHTETGNIWTHFIGAISFIAIATYFLTRPSVEVQLQEKFIFGTFFMGAITCLVCSTLFHVLYCHSPSVSKIFNKIDYAGISILTMGSFVPWLYYAFYCDPVPKIVYLIVMGILGTACIIVSLWDKFSEPEFRAVRAGMFIVFGLSGVIPGVHYTLSHGVFKAFTVGALGWLILMGILYITGACLYAARIPERLFPGKFDIWFQSHQIFHVFVLAAAYVHYHGITRLASHRLTIGDCLATQTETDYSFEL